MADIVKIAAVVIREGKILMVKKYSQNFLGMLGGTLEPNETIINCVMREIPEECGVTNFEIKSQEPFYIANSFPATDPTKTLEMQCFMVDLFEDPIPTYNPEELEMVKAGYDISQICWIGKDDFEITEVEGKTICKLKTIIKDDQGNIITLTPITENIIFPEFIKRGLIK